ncbi:calcium-binding protein [Auraticoccus sp. F435]|uniref:Calcium-binding protein n=1 Tax=Auraticoccus cholistanensis TaxID=2656650 RepID=A0A6A9UT55_9ACTN|nr:calcium-binding protein [Auraticoccus cholistanensis]
MLAAPLTSGLDAADAAPKPKSYKNCTALQKDYPHGVAKKGARDKVTGKAKPVKNFTVSTKVYKLNDGPRNARTGEYDLDRDNDGVACEKR